MTIKTKLLHILLSLFVKRVTHELDIAIVLSCLISRYRKVHHQFILTDRVIYKVSLLAIDRDVIQLGIQNYEIF